MKCNKMEKFLFNQVSGGGRSSLEIPKLLGGLPHIRGAAPGVGGEALGWQFPRGPLRGEGRASGAGSGAGTV